MSVKVLELGNYVVPAYAGMILAEQGLAVTKWINGKDPLLSLHRGQELWGWLQSGKTLQERHPRDLLSGCDYDIVLDNFRPQTLDAWGIDPGSLARKHRLVWVSMRDECGDRSFDLIAQARSWLEYAPWVPFWVGDTSGGLWLAFKALVAYLKGAVGHHILGQASCLQKLVEGELLIDVQRDGMTIPWEQDPYRYDAGERKAVVVYKGETITEPVRDRLWKLANLLHKDGRIKI